MTATTHQIRTGDGTVDTYVFTPDGQKPKSAILFYMDGLGIRQPLLDMAARMASHGYAVLLPNLYYRAGPAGGTDLMQDRDRMMQLVMSVTNEGTMNDTKHLLAFLDSQPGLGGAKVACVGYCMGGALSLTAVGTYTDRIAAAASLHGARLATDAPDSPHRLAPKMKGEVYVGVSEIDPYLAEGETARLETALKDADANATVEIYPGVQHGFTVPGIPIYDRDASEHHWDRILGLFSRNLPN